MAQFSHAEAHAEPENLVHRLAARLRYHLLWDSSLLFIPPVLATIYALIYLSHSSRISQLTAIAVAGFVLGAGAIAVLLGCRPRMPKVPTAAHLIDERSGAKDHFLTLTTIDPADCPAPLIARLREQTTGFVTQVALKRDFPYKVKRSAYYSIGASLMALFLLRFLTPLAESALPARPAARQLHQLAEKMAQTPRLKELAQELKDLAAKLEDPKMAQEEKQAALQEVEKKIEEQQKKEPEKEKQDLLGQAASTLKGAEQQQSASGQERQKDGDGGGIQSNLPQNGKGEGKQSQGASGDSKAEMSAQLSKDMSQGKSAQGNPKEPGQDKNQQHQGDAKGRQPDPNQPGKEQNQDKTAKGPGGSKEGAGKNQASEEPPQGGPPAERFYKADEGKGGLKDAHYVTVQLPEDLAATDKGDGTMSKESKSKSNQVGGKVPVSNVPLPAHMPNAQSEKQQMPIEYRGIIR